MQNGSFVKFLFLLYNFPYEGLGLEFEACDSDSVLDSNASDSVSDSDPAGNDSDSEGGNLATALSITLKCGALPQFRCFPSLGPC